MFDLCMYVSVCCVWVRCMYVCFGLFLSFNTMIRNSLVCSIKRKCSAIIGLGFFWRSDEHKKEVVRWSILCKPRYVGGLGILNLGVQNICFLSKWICNLMNGEGVWQEMLGRTYSKNKSPTQVLKQPGDSQFWSELVEIEDLFLSKGTFEIHNGNQTRFL